MIYDTHSHCYWDALEPQIDDIIARMKAHHIVGSTQIGCDVVSSRKAISLARSYPHVFRATVGLHPESAQDEERYMLVEEFEKLILENRELVVAVGETGLDFHYLDGSEGGSKKIDLNNLSSSAEKQIDNQKNWWRIQHELGLKYDLPLVIHTRDAREATLEFMKTEGVTHAVMHCFSEDWEFARELLDFSDEIYFSFSGILTYKSAKNIQEAASKIPLDRILIETDAPFLAPEPVRGTVNEPANTRYVLEKLIALRTESRDEIENIVYQNSLGFYGIVGS